MKHTTEIRWMFATDLPAPVVQWFAAGQPPSPPRQRSDDYLLFPGCDSVGTKCRDGDLQIKVLRAPPPVIALPAGVQGRCGRWSKWCFESHDLRALQARMHSTDRWLTVDKTSHVRQYACEPDDRVTEVAPEADPDSGCRLDLTLLRSAATASPWYTLGFEAFGTPERTDAALEAALAHVFGRFGPPPGVVLTEADSLSYPAWLLRIT